MHNSLTTIITNAIQDRTMSTSTISSVSLAPESLSVPDWTELAASLFDVLSDGISFVRPSGEVLLSNRYAVEHLGLHPGTNVESRDAELWKLIRHALRNHRKKQPMTLIRNTTPYRVNIAAIRNRGRTSGALCIFQNGTELEKVTQQMLSYQELSRELDMIIESSYDGLWICDGNANVLRINSASERLNEIRAEQVVGRNMRELVAEGFINRSATLEVLRTRSIVNMLQKTSKGRKLMITGSPFFDKQGNLVRVVVNERDITEIDALHEELERQEALKNQYRNHLVEMQIAEMESRHIIARTPCMTNVLQQAIRVSKVDTTVLIQGESGVGKGLIAELIHRRSERSRKPLIRINCGAIPESLMESELFGYEAGAFTGASKSGKPGYLELAHEGTLFMDEIGELPFSAQVKLLRFLEDGLVTRIGGTKARSLNVRILTATNRNLSDMVSRGLFRKDLFYRLNVIPITIPPLRERKECILPLIQHYFNRFAEKVGKAGMIRLSKPALDALIHYPYPGNVRELINLCERLAVMSESDVIAVDQLPSEIIETMGGPPTLENSFAGRSLKEMIERFEHMVLTSALREHRTQERIATALQVDQSTIARKLRRHGLRPS